MNGVYILQSTKSDRYYVGSTDDIERRLEQHNSGYVSSTKGMRPWRLVLFQQFETLAEARSVERKVKKMKRRDFLEKMIKNGKIVLGP